MKIGVLALQGDFKEHIIVLKKLNIEYCEVRLEKDLEGVSGLIIPGGESTTIGKLMHMSKLDSGIVKKNKSGMPIYGTCAGAILLSKRILESNQPKLGLLDISIKRNDYGRQIDSFTAQISSKLGKISGVFIRAPIIKEFEKGVKVLAEHEKNPVLVRQGDILASTFHPELTNDYSVHKYFVEMVKEKK